MPEFELRKFLAPEVVFGVGSIHLAGQYFEKYSCRKAFVVTDPGVRQAGWAQLACEGLPSRQIDFLIYDQISPNPRSEQVTEGARQFKENGCDCILAVGGGSPIDCAKGIGIIASNAGTILDYEGVDKIFTPMPPLICIPTTSGTSADVSQFSIITDTEHKNKIAIISKAIVPDVSLVDPQTLLTMDPYLTACTGIDALVHAIEAFVSTGHSPLTDTHALEAIRVIQQYLPQCIADPENLTYRSHMMQASLQAGLAFSNASLGATHAAAHSLGGYFDFWHGECNALLLPQVVDFNYSSEPERFGKIAEAMGIDTRGMNTSAVKKALIGGIFDLRKQVGITEQFGAKGVRSSEVGELASKAVKDPCLVTNPRHANQRDIEVIYEESL